jgi:hypothetical protein
LSIDQSAAFHASEVVRQSAALPADVLRECRRAQAVVVDVVQRQ